MGMNGNETSVGKEKSEMVFGMIPEGCQEE
jgi:hypothetical protein